MAASRNLVFFCRCVSEQKSPEMHRPFISAPAPFFTFHLVSFLISKQFATNILNGRRGSFGVRLSAALLPITHALLWGKVTNGDTAMTYCWNTTLCQTLTTNYALFLLLHFKLLLTTLQGGSATFFFFFNPICLYWCVLCCKWFGCNLYLMGWSMSRTNSGPHI